MIVEISVAMIALILLVWMIGFLILLRKAIKTFESTLKDIHNVSSEAIELTQKLDLLVDDLKSKSDSLDFVFRPFKAIGKGKQRPQHSDTMSEIVEWVGVSLTLFNKMKNLVSHREKR